MIMVARITNREVRKVFSQSAPGKLYSKMFALVAVKKYVNKKREPNRVPFFSI